MLCRMDVEGIWMQKLVYIIRIARQTGHCVRVHELAL